MSVAGRLMEQPTAGFAAPPFATGRGSRFSISASQVSDRHSPFSCPMGLSLRTRHRAGSLQPAPATGWRPRFDAASKLNLAVARCLPELLDGTDVRRILDGQRDLTHSQRRFLRHALDVLPDLVPQAEAAAGAEYRLGEDIIGRVERPSLTGKVTVWAVHLQTADQLLHEAVRWRLVPLREQSDADRDWIATAAAALSSDDAVPAGARLRISEFSVTDGEYRCHFDGSTADAARIFTERGRPLWEALDGSVYRPGSACSACPFLRVCPAVPQVPGILGIAQPAVATRHLSASDLVAYGRCPTSYRVLRADHLPPRYAEDADPGPSALARDRGVAVHAWLQWAHSRTPARACTARDLPDSGAGPDIAIPGGLDPESYAAARPFLVQHLQACPLAREELTGWAPERTVAVHDPDADLVVISTPDLACRQIDSGEPVWRETKTAGAMPPDQAEAFRRYPDFALNVVLLAAFAEQRGGTARADLEVLTPAGDRVLTVGTGDVAAVDDARRLVGDIAGRFAADVEFARSPSGACRSCPAHGWCDPPDDFPTDGRAGPGSAAAAGHHRS
jgi:hypothetical protein